MPLSKQEFEDLAALIEKTEPQGSPARILLADYAERQEKLLAERRAETLEWIQKDYGYSADEAERILKHIGEGGKLGEESRKCHICKGSGTAYEPRCMGFESVRCTKCHGNGRASYMITLPNLPPEPAQEDPRPPSE